MKKRHFLFLILISPYFYLGDVVWAGEITVTSVSVVEYGIYGVTKTKSKDASNTSLGTVNIVNGIKLIKETDNVPGKLGTRFGFRYIVKGPNEGTQVRIMVKVLHPKTINPKTKKETTIDQWNVHTKIGQKRYNGWGFDHPWEIVPGKWTIQIWHSDNILAERAFSVYPTN